MVIKIGSLNVRKLTNKHDQIWDELKGKNLDTILLQEIGHLILNEKTRKNIEKNWEGEIFLNQKDINAASILTVIKM